MSWKNTLKKAYDIEGIRRIDPDYADEVERMEYFIKNEEIVMNLIEDIERFKKENDWLGHKEAVENAINNISPPHKKDDHIFNYNMSLYNVKDYEDFKTNPIASMEDVLSESVYYFGREGY